MSHTAQDWLHLAARGVNNLSEPIARSSFLLLPDLKVIKQHGHSTTQDREPVSDGYTAPHYHRGRLTIHLSLVLDSSALRFSFGPSPLTWGNMQISHFKTPCIGTMRLSCL